MIYDPDTYSKVLIIEIDIDSFYMFLLSPSSLTPDM